MSKRSQTIHDFSVRIIKAEKMNENYRQTEIDKVYAEAKNQNICINEVGNYLMQNHESIKKSLEPKKE